MKGDREISGCSNSIRLRDTANPSPEVTFPKGGGREEEVDIPALTSLVTRRLYCGLGP